MTPADSRGPRRIGLVIGRLRGGGAEGVCASMANAFAKSGHAVKLFTFDEPGETPYYPLDPAVDVFPLGMRDYAKGTLEAVRQTVSQVYGIRRAIAATGVDVVMGYMDRMNVLLLMAMMGTNVPVIATEHTHPVMHKIGRRWEMLRKWLYRRADAVTIPSSGAAAALEAVTGVSASVIPNAVEARAARIDGATSETVVAAGRLHHLKGFDDLLRAFAIVHGENPIWSLVIRGEGPARKELETLRDRLGLGGHVQLPGMTEEAGTWVNEGEIFVLSSRSEAFGNVVVEAMASGLPVIATDCPSGPGEIINDGVDGLLVPPEDPEALAAAIDRLMAEPGLRRRLGEAGRESAQRFTLARVMPQWEALIDQVVEERAARSRRAP